MSVGANYKDNAKTGLGIFQWDGFLLENKENSCIWAKGFLWEFSHQFQQQWHSWENLHTMIISLSYIRIVRIQNLGYFLKVREPRSNPDMPRWLSSHISSACPACNASFSMSSFEIVWLSFRKSVWLPQHSQDLIRLRFTAGLSFRKGKVRPPFRLKVA